MILSLSRLIGGTFNGLRTNELAVMLHRCQEKAIHQGTVAKTYF